MSAAVFPAGVRSNLVDIRFRLADVLLCSPASDHLLLELSKKDRDITL